MADLSTAAVLALFIGGAVVTYVAGVNLAKATDALDTRFGLGEAIGGMILLSIAGSLPELAITVSAAMSGHLAIAAGNLIGGIAMQTFVLVIADVFVRGKRPLSTCAASLVPALEGLLVIAVVTITVMSAVVPASATIGGTVSVGSVAIAVTWVAGLLILNKTRTRTDLVLALPDDDPAPAPIPTAPGPSEDGPSMRASAAIALFALASVVTLGAGVLLERSGNQLATDWDINGVVFGATVLSFATALPEISSGITGARLGRYTLVFGDIFGGNAFQVSLFLVADLIAGQPVLPSEGSSNAWIGSVGIVMTAVYVAGILLRPRAKRWRLGPDSWVATIVYVFGLWGLVYISS